MQGNAQIYVDKIMRNRIDTAEVCLPSSSKDVGWRIASFMCKPNSAVVPSSIDLLMQMNAVMKGVKHNSCLVQTCQIVRMLKDVLGQNHGLNWVDELDACTQWVCVANRFHQWRKEFNTNCWDRVNRSFTTRYMSVSRYTVARQVAMTSGMSVVTYLNSEDGKRERAELFMGSLPVLQDAFMYGDICLDTSDCWHVAKAMGMEDYSFMARMQNKAVADEVIVTEAPLERNVSWRCSLYERKYTPDCLQFTISGVTLAQLRQHHMMQIFWKFKDVNACSATCVTCKNVHTATSKITLN